MEYLLYRFGKAEVVDFYPNYKKAADHQLLYSH